MGTAVTSCAAPPAAEVSRGVAASWAVMTGVALALVAVSVIVADRLATRVTRPARELADAAALLGDGDLSARSTAHGPAELAAAGHAFNAMAERLSGLITAERVMSADLPHRLRTPLTALRMNAAALGPGRAADDTRTAIERLEQQVDLIIRAARRPGPDEPAGCDAASVLADRFEFWSALAEDQRRPCHLTGADLPVPVPVPRSDLVAAADALIGNIFKHTAEGTGFAVTLHRGEDMVLVLVADAGQGIADTGAAVRREQRRGVYRPRARHRPPRRRVHRRRAEDRHFRARRRAGPAAAAHGVAGAGRAPGQETSLIRR